MYGAPKTGRAGRDREHKCLSVGPLLEDARSATSQLEGRVYLARSPQESKNLGICIHSTIRRQRQATLPDYRDMNLAWEPCGGLQRPNRETTGSVDD